MQIYVGNINTNSNVSFNRTFKYKIFFIIIYLIIKILYLTVWLITNIFLVSLLYRKILKFLKMKR